MQGSELRSRPGTEIPSPIMRGESPRGLDTELYGETNEKDSWGPRSLWPTRRFRVNSREVGQPDIMFCTKLCLSGKPVSQDFAPFAGALFAIVSRWPTKQQIT